MIVTVHKSSETVPFAIFYCDKIEETNEKLILWFNVGLDFYEHHIEILSHEYDYIWIYEDDKEDRLIKNIKNFCNIMNKYYPTEE